MDENELLKDYNLEVVEDEVEYVGEVVGEPEMLPPDKGVEVLFQDELRWLFYIIPDKWLGQLIDRVEYGAENMEYYYDKKALSCGAMRHIVRSMKREVTKRRDEGRVIQW